MRSPYAIILVLLLVLTTALPALATPTPTATPQPTQSPEASASHTLVIEQVNGSIGYTVTVSGNVTLKDTESGESITGHTVNGRVGGLPWKESVTDSKDVIHFTGQLKDFEYEDEEGTIRVTLDGEQIDPDSLVGTPPPPPSPTSTETLSPPPTPVSTTRATSPSPTLTPVPAPTVDSPDARASPTTTASESTTMSVGGGPLSDLGWVESLLLGIVVFLALAGVGLLLSLR